MGSWPVPELTLPRLFQLKAPSKTIEVEE